MIARRWAMRLGSWEDAGVVVPSGTVTFLFTDIVGSTRLWQVAPEAMPGALERHDLIVRSAVESKGGYVFSTGGDGFGVAFARAGEAVVAAVEAQARLGAEGWPKDAVLRVRMGVHTGEVVERSGDYFGTAVNQTARLMALGHGGQVSCSQATAGLLGSGVEVADLGVHRLRDLSAPVRVFQVGGGSFPPLRSMDRPPGNLPRLASSFVGRGVEMAAVAEELGTARLVTITGVGGMGKTRLGLQVAAMLAPNFAEGAWICELAAAATGDELAQVVASALGVAQRAQMSLVESIVDFLRTRHLLVVLDNCEHLLGAAAGLAAMILAGAPVIRMLATSREPLGIGGEHVRPLRPLGLPSEAGEAASSDAVMLFVERANDVEPDFVADASALSSVVEICRRVDGIPLAIELAAARVVTMTPADIAGHLDERFRLLTAGRRDRVERHQTLRAAIEWSYALLTDTERVVFDRLGVFPASFDETAAVAICGSDLERWDVIDALASLANKSMVATDRSGDTARYQLLETLRHFTRDRAGTVGELDGLRRRHAVFFAGFAERAGAGVMSDQELAWRPRLAVEMDNLRAAAGWALDAPDIADVGLGVAIVGGLAGEALYRPSSGILAWATAGLARCDELDAAQRQILLGLAAFDAYQLGPMGPAASLGLRAIAESDTFTPGLVAALAAASVSALAGGDAAGAMAALADGRARLDASGTSDWTAVWLSGAASLMANAIGDHDTARAETERNLAAARRIGAPTLLASALYLDALTNAMTTPTLPSPPPRTAYGS